MDRNDRIVLSNHDTKYLLNIYDIWAFIGSSPAVEAR